MAAKYEPNVEYWVKTIETKEKIHISEPCFSEINRNSKYSKFQISDTKKIYYKCVLDYMKKHCELSADEINFYINFLYQILGKNVFKYRLLKDGNILFVLDTDKLGRAAYKNLMILSMLRNPQEFPEIIRHFYENQSTSKNIKEKLEQNFIQFQNSHNEELTPPLYDNRCGHSLVYSYGGFPKPIDLKKFKENLKIEKYSAQGYFKN